MATVTGRQLYDQLATLLGLEQTRNITHMTIELPADGAVTVRVTAHVPFAGRVLQRTLYQLIEIEEPDGANYQTLPD